MTDKYYKILGVTEDATDEEIASKYFELRKKYLEERFLDGEKGNEAARRLTEVDNAYEEIKRIRNESADGGEENLYKKVDAALKRGDFSEAQSLLDSFDQRGAEWHYLQSVVFYKKGWMNECKKQLEIAISLDGENKKYKETYDRLLEKMKGQSKNSEKFDSHGNRNAQGNTQNPQPNFDEPQMGGDSCMEFCCRMAICNMCLNCCCNMR